MKNIIKEFLPYVIIVVIVLLIRAFLVTPIRVNGPSMNDTLADKEIMLLYKVGKIEREDIVVIDKSYEGKKIIKRVIALPGETIECQDGVIYINGKEYDDKYATNATSDFDLIELEDDEYFVLGDNRMNSEDARDLGPVNEKLIEGKTNLVIFPFKDIRKVK